MKGDGRPIVSEGDRARVLAALACVDAVAVFDEPTPEQLLADLARLWVKGGDYALADLPEAGVVQCKGGESSSPHRRRLLLLPADRRGALRSRPTERILI